MPLNRKVAATALAVSIAGLILTPAIAVADDFPRDPIQVPPGEDVYRPPESNVGDLHIDDYRLPDLSYLPDFDDFDVHFKHEKKSTTTIFTTQYPDLAEPIALPSQAPTDSLELPAPDNWVPPVL